DPLTLQSQLLFVQIRIVERHIRNAVWNKVDAIGCRAISVFQDPLAALVHYDEARRQTGKFVHDIHLFTLWLLENCMEVGNDREIKSSKQSKQMTTGGSSVDAEFMLDAEHIDISRLQEIGCRAITAQILFGD